MRIDPASGLLATLIACSPAASPTTAETPSTVETKPASGGKCDQAALRAAADATDDMLKAWTPTRGELPDYRQAVQRLRAACPGLPPGFHGFLEYGVHPVPHVGSQDMQLGTPLRDDPEGLGPLLRHCPDHAKILADVAVRPASERIPTIFEGCKFAELGVFTLPELAMNFGDAGGFTGHALYLWLVDDGAPPAVARALVRPIVAGSNYALEIGTSRAKLPAAGQGPAVPWHEAVLYASSEAVAFDERPLVSLAQGRLGAGDHSDSLIGAVFDALAEEADKRRALAERSGYPQEFALALAGDPTLTWETMGKLVFTAGRAGAQKLDVSVLVPDPMRPIAALPLLAAGPAPTLDLQVRPDGLTLRCAGKTATPDAATLVGAVSGCGGGSLRLAATPDSSWQRLVEVLAALSGQVAITEVVPP